MMMAKDDARTELALTIGFAALTAPGPLLIALELPLTAGQAAGARPHNEAQESYCESLVALC